MHICLIASEFLGLGTAGGFGFATRSLGRNLVERGHRVTAVLPQPREIAETALTVDGVEVRMFPRAQVLKTDQLFQRVNAQIYHSQEPSLSTYIAQRAVPDAVHVVTSRDPRDLKDWWVEFNYPSRSRVGVLRTAAFYENPLCRKAVRDAARVFVPAKCLASKVALKYGLTTEPDFMPTPIRIPLASPVKAERPTVCYIGRLDRRKRPELFFKLAPKFPTVEFIAVGEAQDKRYALELRERFGNIGNLKMLGFVDQFASDQLYEVMSRSWIMVNTAAREGLPNVFLEAASRECAIVSSNDPDHFASRFGRFCADDNFAEALNNLMQNDAWRALGKAGAKYVRETNSADLATERHILAYQSLLS